jgi:hypothetical protein
MFAPVTEQRFDVLVRGVKVHRVQRLHLEPEPSREIAHGFERLNEVRRTAVDLLQRRKDIRYVSHPTEHVPKLGGQQLVPLGWPAAAQLIDGDIKVRGHLHELVVTRPRPALPRDEAIWLYANLPRERSLADRRRSLKSRADRSLDRRLGHHQWGQLGTPRDS